MKEDIEDIIINKIKNGDLHACRFIVDKYKSYVYNVAFKIVKGREDAEEIAQDSFINAFKSIESFKFESKFSTWLYRITFNNAISHTRRKKIFKDEISDSIIESLDVSIIADGFENLSRIDRKKILTQAIEKLNEEEKLLVTLYYYEENSIAEVSKITGLEENFIKVKIHRSRKKLFNLLSEIMGIKMEDVL